MQSLLQSRKGCDLNPVPTTSFAKQDCPLTYLQLLVDQPARCPLIGDVDAEKATEAENATAITDKFVHVHNMLTFKV